MQVAVAHAAAGQTDTALEILRDLIAMTEQSGQRWLDAELHRVRGELLLRDDPTDVREAEGAFRKALEIARGQQTKTFELRAAIGLAHLSISSGREASDVLTRALIDLDPAQELPELEQAKKLFRRSYG
jgi:predicted ATPase